MLAVQVTIRDFPNSSALETNIRDRAEKLTQFYQRIGSCRVVVDFSQKHKRKGKLYNVHVDLSVPGKELVVTHKQDEDVYVAVRDAFDAIERQLEKYAKQRRGNVKTHEPINRGYIVRLFPSEGFGFIHGIDGNEFYFSAGNVAHPQFDKLVVGDRVLFLELPASEGLQAHRVTLEKHSNLTGDDSLH